MFDEQNVRVFRQYFGWRADVVDLRMPATLVISSLSLFISSFEGAVVGLNMSGFLALIASSIVPGFAPTSRVVRRSGRIFSLIIRSVGWILYYIGVTSWTICEWFPPSYFSQNCACDFGVLYCYSRHIAHSCVQSFSRRGEIAHEQHWSQFVFDYRPLS